MHMAAAAESDPYTMIVQYPSASCDLNALCNRNAKCFQGSATAHPVIRHSVPTPTHLSYLSVWCVSLAVTAGTGQGDDLGE